MQQIKLIALDLDGTALNDKSHLPDYTREVLEQAARQASAWLLPVAGPTALFQRRS